MKKGPFFYSITPPYKKEDTNNLEEKNEVF